MNTNIELKLPISALVPSRTNRKTFDGGKLDELADNIKTVGLLQPPLVRPLAGKDDVYEIVYGERRWRACKLAGFESIECKVRELTDRQAAEIQLVENLQREDVDMVEEAQILQRMLDLEENGSRVYNAASLAVRLGKSKGYVSHRLHLVHLPRTAKDALRSGKLQPTTAELIGRLPKADARNAVTKAVLELSLTFQATKELIQREYMRSLKSAPFSREDAELCPAAGSCEGCPKRTGNMDLDNVKDGWVCCDPDCYAEKAEAAWQRQTAAAREAGQEVLSDEECRRAFPDGRNLGYDAPWVILSTRPPEDIIKVDVIWRDLESWEKLLGDAVAPVLARVPDTGRTVDLARLEHCLTAAVEQGHADLFKEAILRRYGAAAGGGERRTLKVEEETSNGGSEPTKGEKSQRDAMRDLNALRSEVADFFAGDALSVDAGEAPDALWNLIIQAATINVGAQGRKAVLSWFGEDAEAWSFACSGRVNVDANHRLRRVLALLVSEWEPHMQRKFLGQMAEYVGEVSGDLGENEAYAIDALRKKVPKKYRLADLDLPDIDVTCDVYMADGSERLAYRGLSEDETEEIWIDSVSGESIEALILGWEYYEEDDLDSDEPCGQRKFESKIFGRTFTVNDCDVVIDPEPVEFFKKTKAQPIEIIGMFAETPDGVSTGHSFETGLSDQSGNSGPVRFNTGALPNLQAAKKHVLENALIWLRGLEKRSPSETDKKKLKAAIKKVSSFLNTAAAGSKILEDIRSKGAA